jgi:hypothetical protein
MTDESKPEVIKAADAAPSGKRRLNKARKRVELEIEDDDGAVRDYVVVEMSGAVRDQWLTEQAGKVRLDPKTGQPTGVKDFKGSMSGLIAKCLFTADGKPVGEDEIQKWSSSIQKELSDLCGEINGLTDKAAEAAKKD